MLSRQFVVIYVVVQLFYGRHVYLPPDIAPTVPVTHLMTESEWRNLGIQMSTGWMHYMENSSSEHLVCVLTDKCVTTGENQLTFMKLTR